MDAAIIRAAAAHKKKKKSPGRRMTLFFKTAAAHGPTKIRMIMAVYLLPLYEHVCHVLNIVLRFVFEQL